MGEPMQTDIDEGLYSRQLYVLGHDAMRRMQASNILLVGCNGVGIEIAKNLALAGVKSLTLCDPKPIAICELSSQFYFTEADVGKNRAEVSAAALRDLNPYCEIKLHAGDLSSASITPYQVVVAADMLFSDAENLDATCQTLGIKFIYSSSKGVFSCVFVGLGQNFVVTDATGEEALSCMISHVSQENPGVVTTQDEVRHGMETGDYVTFTEVQGMAELNGCEPLEIKVTGPYTFTIGDTSKMGAYKTGGYVKQVKMPKTVSFKSMRESKLAPEFCISDFAKIDRQEQLVIGFEAVDTFAKVNNGAMPLPANNDHAAQVVALAKEINSKAGNLVKELDEKLLCLLASNARGDLSPMAAVLGGVVAQEALKACSGKFMPILQWLVYDCTECLPDAELPPSEYQLSGSRYDGQIAVFGKSFQAQLESLNYFLVGAGAIGCEMLKNWAMMGLGCGPKGCVHLTDMDTIEKSNLNRQFLFRTSDIQKLKSTTAAEAVTRMNKSLNIKCYQTRVGPDSEEVFDDDFFEGLDGVCNALDNVQARLYMDQRCIYYQKSLLESGTLGTKGNVQVVVPNLTESYGSSRDPPEKSIPICTLKNFPNAIEHTIQWARDEFEGLFKQSPDDANAYITDPEYVAKLKKQPGTALTTMEGVRDNLVLKRPKTFTDCVVWARLKFEELYVNNIKQLLFNFPIDMVTAGGTPFWSGPKRPPAVATFDASNALHVDFIVAAANMRAAVYGLATCRDGAVIKAALANVMVPEFVPQRGVKIQVNEAEAAAAAAGGDVDEMQLDSIAAALPDVSTMSKLAPVEFEKDDDRSVAVEER